MNLTLNYYQEINLVLQIVEQTLSADNGWLRDSNWSFVDFEMELCLSLNDSTMYHAK